ncbi:HET-domain-containing protein [Mollisia scopiformis]|uniref:HET-domain-containing protein n=1 Tax=Mollisia scopiformis TaxID=149040 RepID=A0A194WXM4_MOLSC|nr:HET-domain-containing protein [Mollisia scopiformis]KUJ12429.1 HET-domain-containing protein [Mollisia scopiformis]
MDHQQEVPQLGNLPPLYHPLDPSKHEIRLLRILPSHDKATTIHCELETTTLDVRPSYRALSYEWNPPNAVKSFARVFVNGHEIDATSNLRHALAHLNDGPSFAYWIDALCINQSDKVERGHQVQSMRSIYHQARQVLVWLGLDSGNMSLGMDLVTELASQGLFPQTKLEARQSLLLAKLVDPLLKPHWDGVIRIFTNTYWSRTWIVQEIVVSLPLETPLLCDLKSIPLEYISSLLRYIKIYVQPIKFGHSLAYDIVLAGRTITELLWHRTRWRELGTDFPPYDMSLLRNLVTYDMQECQDPRDKVYALLGISTPVPGVEFPISYTDPVSEVFRNVAKHIIEGSQRLDILLDCHNASNRSHSAPSWAPDWEHYRRGCRTIYYDTNGWDASSPLSTKGSFRVDNMVLRSRGFIIGEISTISKEFQRSKPVLAAMSFRSWLNFVTSTWEVPSASKRKPRNWLKPLISGWKTPQKQSDKAAKVDTENWESALEALYDAIVKTALQEQVYGITCPFDKFRSYCEKLIYDSELPAETEWPFAVPHDAARYIAGSRLCSIKLSSEKGSGSLGYPGTNYDIDMKNTVGLCPSSAKYGDVVAVLRGCKYPLVLRRVSDGEGYEVINSAYVYGFMKGEVVKMMSEVDIELV